MLDLFGHQADAKPAEDAEDAWVDPDDINDEFFSVEDLEAIVRREIEPLKEELKAATQETPLPVTSFHQITLFYWLPSSEEHLKPMSTRLLFLVGSYVLLAMQCMVGAAIMVPGYRPTCFLSDSCFDGQWCKVDGMVCQPCLFSMKEMCEAQDLEAWTQRYAVENLNSWNYDDFNEACDACYRGDDDDEDRKFVTETQFIKENIHVMVAFDWVALFLTTVIVAAQLSDEMNDIWITRFLVKKLSANGLQPSRPIYWRLHYVIRLHALVPLLISAIPIITAFSGGTAMNVCLNAVAIVFLADLDEYVVNFVPEALRKEAEDNAGEVFGALTDVQDRLLTGFKIFNMCTITLGVLVAVYCGNALRPQMVLVIGTASANLIPLAQLLIRVIYERYYKIKNGEVDGSSICKKFLILLVEFFIGVVFANLLWFLVNVDANMGGYGVLTDYDDQIAH